MNIELLHDGHQAVAASREQAAAMRAVVIGAAATTVATVAEHQQLTISPRRFVVGVALLSGLGIVRGAVCLLPREAPTRVFILGMLDGVPVHWRDLAAFSRQRPTRSEVA